MMLLDSTPSWPARGPCPCKFEVRNEGELREALDAGRRPVLLDNMTPEAARRSVQLARNLRRDCVIEISGASRWTMLAPTRRPAPDFLSSGADRIRRPPRT